ncbi:MAG: hypothetical protein ABIH11_00720 [Candidatus Altiarchaeota archaeon]
MRVSCSASQKPDEIFKHLTDVQPASEGMKAEKREYTTIYSFPSRKDYGRITVYNPVFHSGNTEIPFNLSRLASPEGRDFVAALTRARLDTPYGGPQDERDLPYYRIWEKHRTDESSFICSVTGSFRRHVLGMPCVIRGEESMLEAKIPGEDVEHRQVSLRDFDYTMRMVNRYGFNAGFMEPVMSVYYPDAESELYGERRREPMLAVFFRHHPNRRLYDHTHNEPVSRGYLQHVAKNCGMSVENLVEDVACSVFDILGKIHAEGILIQGEAFLWNYILTEKGKTMYVPDFDQSREIEYPEEYQRLGGTEVADMTLHTMRHIIEPNILDPAKRTAIITKCLKNYADTMRRYNAGLCETGPIPPPPEGEREFDVKSIVGEGIR